MITQRHSRLLGKPQYLGASEIQRRCAVGGEVQPATNNDAIAVGRIARGYAAAPGATSTPPTAEAAGYRLPNTGTFDQVGASGWD